MPLETYLEEFLRDYDSNRTKVIADETLLLLPLRDETGNPDYTVEDLRRVVNGYHDGGSSNEELYDAASAILFELGRRYFAPHLDPDEDEEELEDLNLSMDWGDNSDGSLFVVIRQE